MITPPIVINHDGIHVVRDDLFPGGTKARWLIQKFRNHPELVYASPAEGGAQTALAHAAKVTGRKATIFVAKRAKPHARALMAKDLGAKIMQVTPGHLSVVKARAKRYCELTEGARLLPFGMNSDDAIEAFSAAAKSIDFYPDEVWCAAGSGVLIRSLNQAWPLAKFHAVQIGRALDKFRDCAGADIHVHPLKFGEEGKAITPFPADRHYDAKAWELCASSFLERRRELEHLGKTVLFWNVTGPAIA